MLYCCQYDDIEGEKVLSDILIVQNLHKTFRLSARQQKLEQTKTKVREAVKNLSFTAKEGEIYGLLGPNGAGKTTTLRMIATLIKPDSGDAILDGASVVKEPELVRKKIGFLTSELKLEEFFTPDYLEDFEDDFEDEFDDDFFEEEEIEPAPVKADEAEEV